MWCRNPLVYVILSNSQHHCMHCPCAHVKHRNFNCYWLHHVAPTHESIEDLIRRPVTYDERVTLHQHDLLTLHATNSNANIHTMIFPK